MRRHSQVKVENICEIQIELEGISYRNGSLSGFIDFIVLFYFDKGFVLIFLRNVTHLMMVVYLVIHTYYGVKKGKRIKKKS